MSKLHLLPILLITALVVAGAFWTQNAAADQGRLVQPVGLHFGLNIGPGFGVSVGTHPYGWRPPYAPSYYGYGSDCHWESYSFIGPHGHWRTGVRAVCGAYPYRYYPYEY